MALDNTSIDLNRGSNSMTLPAELAQDIWAKAVEESAIMQLAQQVILPGTGAAIPVLTGDAAADFVGETHEKPVSDSTLSLKTMQPYKIAVIELFSNEFKRDLPAVYEELARRLPAAIGKKFDETIFLGTAPGSNFDVLSNATAVQLDAANTTVYGQLVKVLTDIGAEGFDVDGWVASPAARGLLLGATDQVSRPIFVADPQTGGIGSVLGAPVVLSRRAYKSGATADIVGFAGDWSQARWGMVDGINIAISEEATVNDGTRQINLWQRNMFAVRVEAEVGFVVADKDAFIKLTATATGATGATS